MINTKLLLSLSATILFLCSFSLFEGKPLCFDTPSVLDNEIQLDEDNVLIINLSYPSRITVLSAEVTVLENESETVNSTSLAIKRSRARSIGQSTLRIGFDISEPSIESFNISIDVMYEDQVGVSVQTEEFTIHVLPPETSSLVGNNILRDGEYSQIRLDGIKNRSTIQVFISNLKTGSIKTMTIYNEMNQDSKHVKLSGSEFESGINVISVEMKHSEPHRILKL